MSALAKAIKKSKKTADKKTAKKSTKPELIGDEIIKQAVTDFRAAHKAEKKAKADKTAQDGTLVTFFKREQAEKALAGDYNNSYVIYGLTDDDEVSISATNKVSVIAEDDHDKVEKICGDQFDNLFEYNTEIKVRPEVLANGGDNPLAEKLMKLLGDDDDLFAEFFESTTTLDIKDDFIEKRFKLGKKKLAQLEVFVKIQKPSVK